ncbi:dihydroorotase [Anoxybacter fermentans]|uniref:Dihydroorotase n=1 Tax=Anoxybacter fermentans TaxID=1323375 RepID=A0A3Q9HPU6_9FIRM|nr:dihydroorotase [Anoxybacter fermentans]AZR73010.1 dihydroorotase [Anoxybacter fermentans]
MKKLIKNGIVVDPERGRKEKLDILIENGKIVRIAEKIEETEDVKIIDVTGKYVLPGLVDLHVHLREPGFEHKETIATGTRAAAKGGFTSICCMPNTDPVADNPSVIRYIQHRSAEEGVIRVFPIGAITKGSKGEEIAEIGMLKEAGVVALSDDGRTVMNSGVMRRAMEYATPFDLTFITHCEDHNLVDNGMVNEGYASMMTGLPGYPAEAEEIIIARDIKLAELTGAKLHIAHVTTKGGVELIRQAKARGVSITAEVTPHHLVLCEEDVLSYDTNFKVNPPLRSKEDQAALIEGLQDGTIDIIATDHAPHAYEEKMVEFQWAPFGIAGLETALPVIITTLVKDGKLSLMDVVKKMSTKPAQILDLSVGGIGEGQEADLVVVDLEWEEEVRVKDLVSKGKNNPFIGWKLIGWPVMTMVKGKIVYQRSGFNAGN